MSVSSLNTYASGWPRNISADLAKVIKQRNISRDAMLCFVDDVFYKRKHVEAYIGTSVIPVSEFKDSEPNGVFERNMRYSEILDDPQSDEKKE